MLLMPFMAWWYLINALLQWTESKVIMSKMKVQMSTTTTGDSTISEWLWNSIKDPALLANLFEWCTCQDQNHYLESIMYQSIILMTIFNETDPSCPSWLMDTRPCAILSHMTGVQTLTDLATAHWWHITPRIINQFEIDVVHKSARVLHKLCEYSYFGIQGLEIS